MQRNLSDFSWFRIVQAASRRQFILSAMVTPPGKDSQKFPIYRQFRR
jgi:hypothetical protein